MTYQLISKEAAILNELPQGAYVRDIVPDSPAQKAGIEPGDIIISINNEKVFESVGGLASLINQLKIGDKIEVRLDRNGEEKTVTVQLEAGDH